MYDGKKMIRSSTWQPFFASTVYGSREFNHEVTTIVLRHTFREANLARKVSSCGIPEGENIGFTGGTARSSILQCFDPGDSSVLTGDSFCVYTGTNDIIPNQRVLFRMQVFYDNYRVITFIAC